MGPRDSRLLYTAGIAPPPGKMAVILRTSTLLRLHRALVQRKYRLLYSSGPRRRPGPKGPARELIDAVVEMKRRNPHFGCRKINRGVRRCQLTSHIV
jgi:hypothetical protein